MRKPSKRTPLKIISLLLITSAVVLLVFTISRNDNGALFLEENATWGGISVGGLTPAEAASRVESVYAAPIELRYRDQVIQGFPVALGFKLDSSSMVELASREGETDWWARLWKKSAGLGSLDLQASVDGEILRAYLGKEIAARYDSPPVTLQPIPGTTNFEVGGPGWQLDVQQSAVRISQALMDPVNRRVDLIVNEGFDPTGELINLEIFLKQTIASTGFHGIAEVYLHNPTNSDTVHFAVRDGMEVPPEIAFSAASTIKIPIMVSVLRRVGEPTPENVRSLLSRMIELSENPPADAVMQNVIDPIRAPLEVTHDMQDSLGLKNTFLAGYFYFGAELLDFIQTPANTRSDIDLDPDMYNQTTASDMGQLLTGVYLCSIGQQSILLDAFTGEISRDECKFMLDVLAGNEIGVLSEAGVPDGIQVAHKHGWTEETDGFLHTVSDAGIVFSPGADIVFTIYIYQSTQLLFDPTNELIAQLTQIVFNYYNPGAQEVWQGGAIVFPDF